MYFDLGRAAALLSVSWSSYLAELRFRTDVRSLWFVRNSLLFSILRLKCYEDEMDMFLYYIWKCICYVAMLHKYFVKLSSFSSFI
jgi:hypothetical protein